jgi:hypothetical protein
MSFLLGSRSQASQPTAISGLQLQSSAYGKVIPIVYGATRIAPNLIWYGDFVATPQSQSGGGSGKGGGGGGGKGGGTASYIYQTAVALGLCEGPILSVGSVYVDKNVTSLAGLALSFFSGAYGQAAWGYLATHHPDQALGYSGIAYVAASAYQLGTNAQLPNNNFEVFGVLAGSASRGGADNPDADPSLVVADLLANPHYGCGFPAARIGSLATYQAYCLASGLWVSPAYTDQAQASSMLDDLATATNSAFVWSQGLLTLVPYGDASVSGSGYTYTPPSAPLYNLTDDDFLPNTNATGSSATTNDDPVLLTRTRPSDALNSIKIEALDRTNYYNPAIVEASDQALIQTFGLRPSPSTQMHMFCDLNAARLSAQLQLQRQAIRNTYQFTLDQRYVLLDPMDIVTLTDASLGLSQQWVRITEITENDDASLSITAEEYLDGAASAPLYSFQQGLGYSGGYNADPGDANAPMVFEPTAELAESLEVWLAASGGPLWGGCDVYLSNDGSSYRNIGRITGAARTGLLAAPLAAVASSPTGPTIDAANTLAVDLSESNGQLLSGTQSDALSLATLCYSDGEYIAYENATLTGGDTYDLTWLVRGAYGTSPTAHAQGAAFARIDNAIFKFAYTQDFIGTTIYIKLASFNIYGGGQQLLSDVPPYAYTLTGLAFSSPLPDVTDLASSYVAGITQLAWTEVTDFRPVQYEVRKGGAWTGAQVLGRVAHPPFAVQGNGTYWVGVFSQPLAGLQVYSPNPPDLSVQGAQIVSNVIASYDEAATGWTGVTSGDAIVAGGAVRTGGSGNILAIADYLGTPDILNYGGVGNGIYTITSLEASAQSRKAAAARALAAARLSAGRHDLAAQRIEGRQALHDECDAMKKLVNDFIAGRSR